MLQAGQSPFQRHALAHLKQMQTLVNAICLEEKPTRRDKTSQLTRADEWLSTKYFIFWEVPCSRNKKDKQKRPAASLKAQSCLLLLCCPPFSRLIAYTMVRDGLPVILYVAWLHSTLRLFCQGDPALLLYTTIADTYLLGNHPCIPLQTPRNPAS